MSQKLPVHKNTDHPADALWWKPIFSLQREMNDKFCDSITGFVPPSFWKAEHNLLLLWQENMQRVFGEMFNARQLVTPWLTGGHTEPYINIMEGDKGFKIRADVPGFKPEELDVALSESAVTISGKTSSEDCAKTRSFIHRECCEGSFCRTIALPDNADMEHASAALENNVLIINIPKKIEVARKARKLKITASNDKGPSALTVKKQAA